MHATLRPLVLALPLVLCACIEDEEEITIRADGSATVVQSAEGRVEDVADGHPVPLDPAWRPVDRRTQRWIDVIGSDTGSAAVRDAAAQLRDDAELLLPGKDRETRIAATADFRSVADLPTFTAPETDAFQRAYLERHTRFDVHERNGKHIGVFRRSYSPRVHSRYDVEQRIQHELPAELAARLKDGTPLEPRDRATVATVAAGAFRCVLDTFREDALAAVAKRNRIELPADAIPRLRTLTLRAIDEVVTPIRVQRLLAVIDAQRQSTLDAGPAASDEIRRFEDEAREALRRSLRAALVLEGVDANVQGVVLDQLDELLVAFDVTQDLGDDHFRVVVHLPGRVIGGNATRVDADTAVFEFEGRALRDHSVALEAICEMP